MTWARTRVLSAYVTAIAVLATTLVVVGTPPESASAATHCTDSSEQRPERRSLCINGADGVRARGSDDMRACLAQVDVRRNFSGTARFPRETCSTPGGRVQGEKIAKARFLQWLDPINRFNWPNPDGAINPGVDQVHPGEQWEVASYTQIAKFADVINYEPDFFRDGDPNQREMELWELKTSVAYGSRGEAETSASEQAYGYTELLKQGPEGAYTRWPLLRRASNTGYSDNFTVEKQTCNDRDAKGNPVKTAIDQVFNVTEGPDGTGTIIAERTVNEYKCDEERNKEKPWKQEKPYQANRWWRVFAPGLPDKDVEPKDPNELDLIKVPKILCFLAVCAPKKDEPVKERVLTPVVFTRTDAPASEYWQAHNAPLCAALADAERAGGSATTPIGDGCSTSASLTALFQDNATTAFLEKLDWDTQRSIMGSIWTWVTIDGAGNVSNPARVTGDPHLVTLDGLNYDMQSVGEFDLLAVPDRGIQVQARFAAAGTQSSVVAIATEWGATKLEMRADGTVLANGKAITIEPGHGVKLDDESAGYLVNDDGTYRLSWAADDPAAAPVTLSWQPLNAALGSFGVHVPTGVETAGLLGDNDGNAANDLRTRDGAAIDPTNPVEIHDAYADSWRIANLASYFTYAAGQSTTTFTDRSFPKEIVTTGHFPAADQAAAQQACDAAGVTAGPSFRNCVLDVLVTRNNDFATAFAGVQDSSRSADDKVVGADGKLTETFSGTSVAPNLSPLRVSRDAGYGDVAGPFSDSDQYRFHVPDLPKHDQVTVAFDLIAIGQWDAADAVGVRLDAQPAIPLDLTNATPGMLEDGTPIRTKRITMPLDHYRDLISTTFAGSGLTGTQRFAIDNIEVAARVVAPEAFSPQMQPGVTSELRAPTLATGAGVLERWGARDQYTVTLTRQDVLLDWLTRSTTVKWSLTNSTNGNVVAGGVSSDGNQRLRNLDGTYVLTVEGAGDAQPTSEAYSLNLLVTPKAERFSFELPGPVQLPGDLPSPAVADGAGALETKLSTDLYKFTVKGANRSIVVDPTLCPQQGWRQRLIWSLLDSSGTTVDSGNCWTRTISGLNAGDYTLRVDPESEATGKYRITVTQNGPTTTFAPAPTEASNKRTQVVSFTGTDEATSYQCALDAPSYAGPFTACASPATFSDLADGDHTIQVRAKDKDGNLGPAIKHIVTVDTAVPNMQITRKPPAQSNINGPVLEYSAEKRGMTYQCSLVPVGTAPSFEGCSGVSVYRDLKHGTYRFTVLGTDWVGNQSTISYDFMVDLEPPVIDLAPPSNLTSTSSPQFTFTANEKATYECSLVLASQPDAFTPCASPKQYTGLVDGSQYRFLVKATDVAGQWSARGVTWTPYVTPPSVTITSKPAASSSNAAPSFAFTSTMGNPTYDCSLELASAAASFSPCTSPKSYTGKAAGTYKFTVKATDASGSWVSSTYQFTITAPSGDTQAPSTPGTPTVAIAPAGASLGSDTDVPKSGIPLRIAWAGSSDNVAVSGYQLWYSTNGGAYVNAGNVSGTAVNMNVAPGSTNLRFQIKAYDAAGNVSAASAASTATTVALDQETAASTLLTYSGTWTSASAAAHSGGATKYASASTASATYKAPTGTTQISVVMATGPAAGRATIAVDGGTATTVDLYSSTAGYRTVTMSSASLSASSTHTVVVKPTATKNASSSGTRVDLDAFVTKK